MPLLRLSLIVQSMARNRCPLDKCTPSPLQFDTWQQFKVNSSKPRPSIPAPGASSTEVRTSLADEPLSKKMPPPSSLQLMSSMNAPLRTSSNNPAGCASNVKYRSVNRVPLPDTMRPGKRKRGGSGAPTAASIRKLARTGTLVVSSRPHVGIRRDWRPTATASETSPPISCPRLPMAALAAGRFTTRGRAVSGGGDLRTSAALGSTTSASACGTQEPGAWVVPAAAMLAATAASTREDSPPAAQSATAAAMDTGPATSTVPPAMERAGNGAANEGCGCGGDDSNPDAAGCEGICVMRGAEHGGVGNGGSATAGDVGAGPGSSSRERAQESSSEAPPPAARSATAAAMERRMAENGER
mmetsp:Transcript_88793/g.287002  ORF Transcript_88793/g.287002 Transcript_88793/m.287002 type:complete len:357 (+) Transcript_88793:1777-2847(+)